MIILRQKEFGNKENKAARKRWEAEQGRKASNSIEQFGGLVKPKDAFKTAKKEIQLEKNGGTGAMFGGKEPVDLTGEMEWAYKGKKWKDTVDPDSISVSDDEVLRRKYRDSLRTQKRQGKITNVDQAINKRGSSVSDYDSKDAFSGKKYNWEDEEYLRKKQGRAKQSIREDIKDANKKIYKDYDGNDSDYVKSLRRKKSAVNNKVKDFVKKNKKGLAIGGAALGTAALVGGGIAIHKARKKKAEKEEQEKKNNKKKNK